MTKIVHSNSLTGQQGINLIATIVADMGHLWTPTSAHSDVGIDGMIELCKEVNNRREATGQILLVQSKATTKPWVNENDEGFSFRVDKRDLEHWLNASDPVLLIVSRPRTKEAYWIPVKEYFMSFEAKASRTVCFRKVQHQFTVNTNLLSRCKPESAIHIVGPSPKREIIETNLLPVVSFPTWIYSCETRLNSGRDLVESARDRGVYLPQDWIYHGHAVLRFQPFDESAWKHFVRRPSERREPATKWANSEDPSHLRIFVELLNVTLKVILAKRRIFSRRLNNNHLYYFGPDEQQITREEIWGTRHTCREVVTKVLSQENPERIVCYKHQAAYIGFQRFGCRWYATIEPTYYYTSDGRHESKFRESYLSGIKRLEKNHAVNNNIRFWVSTLTIDDLFFEDRELCLSSNITLASEYGIPDRDWMIRADDEEREALEDVGLQNLLGFELTDD